MKTKRRIGPVLPIILLFIAGWTHSAYGQCDVSVYLAAIDVPLTAEGLKTCGANVENLLEKAYEPKARLYVRARAISAMGFIEDERAVAALRGAASSSLTGLLRAQAVISLTHYPSHGRSADTIEFLATLILDADSLLERNILRELTRLSVAERSSGTSKGAD